MASESVRTGSPPAHPTPPLTTSRAMSPVGSRLPRVGGHVVDLHLVVRKARGGGGERALRRARLG
eukprot:4133140-Pleurochrysis_carterae.AAC.2